MRKVIILGVLCISSVAFAQKKGGGDAKNAPLYTLDTEGAKKPADDTALGRILKSNHVRVCVRADVPPFGYFVGGHLKGLDIALARKVVHRLSIDYKKVLSIDWTVISAGDRVKRLRRGSCDIVVGTFSKTKKRERQVGMSKVYLQTDKVLVSLANVTRKRPVVGRVRGTTGKAKGVKGKIRWFNTYQEVIYAMESGSVDYLVADRPIANHVIRSVNKSYKVGKVLAKKAENYAVGVGKKNKALLDAVNKALGDIAANGDLALLIRRWL